MRHLKSGLWVVVLVCLIYIFMPYGAQAQDDGTDPWPCPDVAVGNSLTRPGDLCDHISQTDTLIPSLSHTLAQQNHLNSLSQFASGKDSIFAPQLSSTRADLLPSMGNDMLYQYALYEDPRLVFDLV